MLVVTHLVSLRQPAGVEAHFGEFVKQSHANYSACRHGWLNPALGIHPLVAARLGAELDHVVDAKHWHGVRLPPLPIVRAWHCRRALQRSRSSLLIVWNRTAKTRFAVDAIGADRVIHWEHGAAWDSGREVERGAYLRRVPLVIANSEAAARVLRLKWNYDGDVRVCRNALRPSLVPPAPVGKRLFPERLRLGVAARLHPVKGVALIVQALVLLRKRGLPVELRIAGEGPERARLAALAADLRVAEHVAFLGAVANMAEFFADIDCLVHAPVTEAFGLVAIEAAAHGCPTVVARVDGLPEAVNEDVMGRAIEPTLPLTRYVELGGALGGLPANVYDPGRDAMVTPRVVDPVQLAVAIEDVFRDAHRYEALSLKASKEILARPNFATHVRDVMAVIEERAESVGR